MLGCSQPGPLATGQMSIYHTGLVDIEWFRLRAFLIAVGSMDKTGIDLTFNNFPEFTWCAEWAYASYTSAIWQIPKKGNLREEGFILVHGLNRFSSHLGTWSTQIILGRCGGITGHLMVARQHRIGSEDRIPPSREHLHLPTSSNLPKSLLPLDYTILLSLCQWTHPPVI